MAKRQLNCAAVALIAACACDARAGRGEPLHMPNGVRANDILQPLRGPYRPAAAPHAEPVAVRDLPTFPDPVRDVVGTSYYVGNSHDKVDPDLKAENERLQMPLAAFGRVLMNLTDEYLRAPSDGAPLATAAVHGMARWADSGAMLGRVNRQGYYHLTWALGAFALDYLKIREDRSLDPAEKVRVERWLRRLAAEVMAYFDMAPNAGDRLNNHGYWAAMAVAAAGVATNDKTLFDWGIGHYSLFLRTVSRDGSLPLELERRSRALHYHLFALAPLVMLAELAQANGIDLYAAGDRALERLAGRCLDGLAAPAAFAKVAGAPQVPMDSSDLAWIEPYHARFPAADVSRWLRLRPLVSPLLGGDLTLAFAAAEAPTR